jgi:hypothetical protein
VPARLNQKTAAHVLRSIESVPGACETSTERNAEFVCKDCEVFATVIIDTIAQAIPGSRRFLVPDVSCFTAIPGSDERPSEPYVQTPKRP